MPRKGDPRVVVRMSPEGHAALVAAAESADVAVGALARECIERHAVGVAREAAAGGIKLRRGSVEKAQGGRAIEEAPEVAAAARSGRAGMQPASSPAPSEQTVDPGVARAAAFRRATLRPR